jgi:hypothetical protein
MKGMPVSKARNTFQRVIEFRARLVDARHTKEVAGYVQYYVTALQLRNRLKRVFKKLNSIGLPLT